MCDCRYVPHSEEITKHPAEIFLDAMMRVVYRNNPFKIAQWKTARHVRRTNKSSKPKDETPADN